MKKPKGMKGLEAIWEADVEISARKSLEKDLEVQTVVIGAGMAGILTAYYLQKKGIRVVVVEAKRIAGGQTHGTTAKITSQHGLCYEKMLRQTGKKRAKAYAMANEQAISAYEQLISDEKIECDFKKCRAYLYTLRESEKAKLKREAEVAAALGISAHYTEEQEPEELPFKVAGAVYFENQAMFHPLKFINHLAQHLEIYENTNVLSVKRHTVFTDKGRIKAKNIVFATHYPFLNVPGFYFLRQHQERSYVLALKGQKELSGMYYGIDEKGLSLRSAGKLLLLGGGGHRTGKDTDATGYAYLRKMAKVYYPEAQEAAAWAAQDCMPHDSIPFIGRYSMIRPYWYVATGFHKWGMTSAMIAALAISNQISCKVFSPQRILIKASVKNLLVDVGESVKGLCKGIFSGKRHRCPHMGCRLEWNAQEESWDCPCHGSRFDNKGKLQDNPAQKNL